MLPVKCMPCPSKAKPMTGFRHKLVTCTVTGHLPPDAGQFQHIAHLLQCMLGAVQVNCIFDLQQTPKHTTDDSHKCRQTSIKWTNKLEHTTVPTNGKHVRLHRICCRQCKPMWKGAFLCVACYRQDGAIIWASHLRCVCSRNETTERWLSLDFHTDCWVIVRLI